MRLAKIKFLGLLAVLVALGVFNGLYFLLPFARDMGFYTVCGFSNLAIVMAAVTTYCTLDRKGLRSKFYGLSLIYVSWVHLAVQIILGFVFMVLPLVPLWAKIAGGIAPLGACLFGLIAGEAGITEIGRIDGAVKEKIFFIKSLQADVEGLAAKAGENSLQDSLRELAEAIRYSDPMSNGHLAGMESDIGVKTASLRSLVEAMDTEAALGLCGELRRLLEERNRKCKLLK
jgi:hypothetical protein